MKYLFFISCALAIFLSSCTKTVDYEPLAQNRIQSFKVINLPDTSISAVLDHIENTITVYVPYYYAMEIIQPEIKLDPNARIKEVVEPVLITNNTTQYTVVAADGKERQYKLIIIQQNTPELVLKWPDDSPKVAPSEAIVIVGNFLSTSKATLRMELIHNTTKKSHLVDVSDANLLANTAFQDYTLSQIINPALDSGYYTVKVGFLGHNVTMDKPLQVYYKKPAVGPFWSTVTVARGETVKCIADRSLFINLNTVKATVNGVDYSIPVKSYTRQEALLTIPDDFPLGDLGSVPFTLNFGDWEPTTVQVPLVIQAK